MVRLLEVGQVVKYHHACRVTVLFVVQLLEHFLPGGQEGKVNWDSARTAWEHRDTPRQVTREMDGGRKGV